jgi:DNA polymerase-3 subunit delta
MRARGLLPDAGAARLLAERVEGNLLAGAQEIEKLLLLRGPGPVDADAVEAAVADNARFDVYALADACLAGEPARAVRILTGLRGEGVEPPLVLWVLARELRTVAGLTLELARGSSPEQALARAGVWERRRPLLARAVHRLGARGAEALLRHTARVDRRIKGTLPGDPWEGLLDLALRLAGRPLSNTGPNQRWA